MIPRRVTSRISVTYSVYSLHDFDFGDFALLKKLVNLVDNFNPKDRNVCQRAGRGVVLALPLIYAGPGLSWPKPSKGLSCLGSYPTLEGQGRARAGLMASK